MAALDGDAASPHVAAGDGDGAGWTCWVDRPSCVTAALSVVADGYEGRDRAGGSGHMELNRTVMYREKPALPAKLFICDPEGRVGEVLLGGGVAYGRGIASHVIGRKTEGGDATLKIDCPLLSRHHGEISTMGGDYYYRDADSLNGTFVNDVLYGRDGRREAAKLRNGDVLHVGKAEGKERHPKAMVMVFSTSYVDGAKWQPVPLTKDVEEINLGRASAPGGLALSNEMVSKNHATFFRWKEGWAVVDHDSTNGVFVNNKRIKGAVALRRLDVVRIVDSYFIFMGDGLLFQCDAKGGFVPGTAPGRRAATTSSGSGAPLVIRIAKRSVWQRFKKLTLLQNINLSINSGEMVLILGGSGAGKTTFMNAVMGYEKADGQIFHGDTDIYREYDRMKYEIGFVPQQDLLRGSDTVYDTLDNAADMKMPKSTRKERKAERIAEVMQLFGLAREQTSLVSKLSGGQRKRLSIAVEYIANPSLFFLDEPDSGLDGIMALSLHKNLRTIADAGKIVMVITHSPDRVADLYDKVIVLAKSVKDNCGHLAFFGSVKDALAFFEAGSLEGVVKRINRPDEGGDGKSDYYIEKYSQGMG
jgi:ABC-type multidrug transport system ATPase subunit/pSer/pThr/pTyr-binding forkhead associated (FHA) protein